MVRRKDDVHVKPAQSTNTKKPNQCTFAESVAKAHLQNDPRAVESRSTAKARVLEARVVFDASFDSVVLLESDENTIYTSDVTTDSVGNRYVSGSFAGNVDFDPIAIHSMRRTCSLVHQHRSMVFVAKYLPDSSLDWVRPMGAAGARIILNNSGDVFVAGTLDGSAVFGNQTLVSSGFSDGYVTKLNNEGQFQWTTRIGTSSNRDSMSSIAVDSAGNVLTVTRVTSSAPNYSLNYGNYAVTKISPNGGQQWSAQFANNYIAAPKVVADSSGNAIVAGTFWGTVDFDPSPKVKNYSSGSSYSGFILKLSPTGKFVSNATFVTSLENGNSGYASIDVLAIDGSNNVVVGGFYGGKVDFAPGASFYYLPSSGNDFLAKLDSSGQLLWANSWQSTGGSSFVATDLTIDGLSNIYLAATFSVSSQIVNGVRTFNNPATFDMDAGTGQSFHLNESYSDGLVIKMNSNGSYVWGEAISGDGDIRLHALALDAEGSLHFAGYLAAPVDRDAMFDFGNDIDGSGNRTISAGRRSAFLLKWRQA